MKHENADNIKWDNWKITQLAQPVDLIAHQKQSFPFGCPIVCWQVSSVLLLSHNFLAI
jgi:hypothetical protein